MSNAVQLSFRLHNDKENLPTLADS